VHSTETCMTNPYLLEKFSVEVCIENEQGLKMIGV